VYNRLCFTRDHTISVLKGYVRRCVPLSEHNVSDHHYIDRAPSTDLQVRVAMHMVHVLAEDVDFLFVLRSDHLLRPWMKWCSPLAKQCRINMTSIRVTRTFPRQDSGRRIASTFLAALYPTRLNWYDSRLPYSSNYCPLCLYPRLCRSSYSARVMFFLPLTISKFITSLPNFG
jgi:hypothetical protein